MFLEIDPVTRMLDWVFDASKLCHLSHTGRVLQWFAKNKHTFFYSLEEGPQFSDCRLHFKGSEALELRGGYMGKGPHTFVACGTFKCGTLFASGYGPLKVKVKGRGVIFIEIPEDYPINGESWLGCSADKKDFLKGELRFLGYKNGLLSESQKAYIGGIMHGVYRPIKLKWYQKLLQLGGIYV